MKVRAAREARGHTGPGKAPSCCGMSKRVWYYAGRPRDIPIGAGAARTVKQVASRRPARGTRRVAAQISRGTGVPANRKRVRRICRKMCWIGPQKIETIRATRRGRFGPPGPGHPREADATRIRRGAGGRRYRFSVPDASARRRAACPLGTAATPRAAARPVPEVSPAGGCIRNRGIRAGNGPQCGSRGFRKPVQAPGVRHGLVWKSAPEQNDHVVPFRGTPERERIWPHASARLDAEVIPAGALADYGHRMHSAPGYVAPDGLALRLEDGGK